VKIPIIVEHRLIGEIHNEIEKKKSFDIHGISKKIDVPSWVAYIVFGQFVDKFLVEIGNEEFKSIFFDVIKSMIKQDIKDMPTNSEFEKMTDNIVQKVTNMHVDSAMNEFTEMIKNRTTEEERKSILRRILSEEGRHEEI
jgi:hypothetical protein